MKELSKCVESNEFYFRVPPGQLQYQEAIEDIMELNTDIDSLTYDDGWTIIDSTPEILMRLTPNTLKGRKNWEIIVVIEKTIGDMIVYKAALLDRSTNDKIGLLTSFNNKQYILNEGERAIKSKAFGWWIGHYRMTAPLIFWNELKIRLTQ